MANLARLQQSQKLLEENRKKNAKSLMTTQQKAQTAQRQKEIGAQAAQQERLQQLGLKEKTQERINLERGVKQQILSEQKAQPNYQFQKFNETKDNLATLNFKGVSDAELQKANDRGLTALSASAMASNPALSGFLRNNNQVFTDKNGLLVTKDGAFIQTPENIRKQQQMAGQKSEEDNRMQEVKKQTASNRIINNAGEADTEQLQETYGNGSTMTMDEIQGISDPYVRRRKIAEFYKEKGLAFDPETFAMSAEEELGQLLDDQQANMTQMEKEIDRQIKQAAKQRNSSISGATAAYSQNREGATSYARSQLPNIIADEANSQFNAQVEQLELQRSKVRRMKQQQQEEWISGRDDQIRREEAALLDMEKELVEAQQAERDQLMDIVKFAQDSKSLAFLDEGTIQRMETMIPEMGGVIRSAVKGARLEALDDQTQKNFDRLSQFKELVSDGTPMSDSMLMKTAQDTGLPLEALVSFNMRAEQINDDKTLDRTQKIMEIEKLGHELDREAKGIVNQNLQNIDYLKSLYQKGASPEEIALTKRAMGIKDEDDPMYRLEVQKKVLENEALNIGLQYLPQEKEQSLRNMFLENSASALDNIIKEVQAANAPMSEQYKLQQLKYDALSNQAEYNETMGIDPEFDTYSAGEFLNAASAYTDGSRGYGAGIDYNDGGKEGVHDGIDIVLPGGKNAQVKAPVAGKVIAITQDNGSKKGWGNSVVWVDKNGREHRIAHLDNIDGAIQVGGTIMPGQYLGNQGNSGFTKGKTGIHVDYRVKQDGAYIDPVQFLKGGLNTSKTAGGYDGLIKDVLGGTMSYDTLIKGKTGEELVKIQNRFSDALNQKMKDEPDPVMKGIISSAMKDMPPSSTEQMLRKGESAFEQLVDLKSTMDTLAENGMTGPIQSWANKANLLNVDVAKMKAQLQGLIPNIARGIFGEVGVLTDTDIENYKKAIGDDSMTTEQMNAVMDNLFTIVYRNVSSQLESPAYNVSFMEKGYRNMKQKIPETVKQELGIFDQNENNPFASIQTETPNDILSQF